MSLKMSFHYFLPFPNHPPATSTPSIIAQNLTLYCLFPMGLINMLNTLSFQGHSWTLVQALKRCDMLGHSVHILFQEATQCSDLLRVSILLWLIVVLSVSRLVPNIMFFFYYFVRMWSQYKEQQLQIHTRMWQSCGKIEEPSHKKIITSQTDT